MNHQDIYQLALEVAEDINTKYQGVKLTPIASIESSQTATFLQLEVKKEQETQVYPIGALEHDDPRLTQQRLREIFRAGFERYARKAAELD
jgi:hypothetical protein